MSEIESLTTNDGPCSVPGFRLGHWTHPDQITGCTVLIADSLVPAVVQVHGGAPGTRETDLLSSGRTVQGVDAVLLTGGSAFGLAAADGVMRWLREHGRGFPTSSINVPIVSGAVIFDLVGSHPEWPDHEAGYLAASSAGTEWVSGRHGGGAGASVSKAAGRDQATRTGIGVAQLVTPAGTVSAIFVNNAFGDVVDDVSGNLLTTPGGLGESSERLLLRGTPKIQAGENTVIGAIVVDQPVDRDGLTRVAVAAHSGVSRAIRPSHTPGDGDTVFALSTGASRRTTSELMQLTIGAQIASARALANSVRATRHPRY